MPGWTLAVLQTEVCGIFSYLMAAGVLPLCGGMCEVLQNCKVRRWKMVDVKEFWRG